MAAALEVINADPAVKSIFVNIFGGITRVDEVAKGIVEAIGRVNLTSPVVHAPRRHQRRRRAGRSWPTTCRTGCIAEPTMLEAARRAVALAAA